MSWMSTHVSVVISPDTTTSPVFTSVSHATRPYGSSRSTASRTPSEIWSAILSGWPSVTDSDVNRYSLSDSWLMGSGREAPVGTSPAKRDHGRFRARARGRSWLRLGRLRVAVRPARTAGTPRLAVRGGRAAARPALVEVDDERHAVHAEARPEAVLQEVGVVAR